VTSPRDSHVARYGLFFGLSALCGVLVAGMALPAVGLMGVSAQRASNTFLAMPSVLQEPVLPQRSRIVAADGTPIATFYKENRVSVPITKIAPVMQQAVIAVEDARFYQNNGIDLRGMLRALIVNSQNGTVSQGGSTITQQYVKNALVLAATNKQERAAATADTFTRKIKEMRLAIGLEKQWSKQQILEGYLNIAYFGAGAYGVEAASRRYFGVHASQLTLPQAATLAGLVQNPSVYDPLVNPKLATQRRAQVLARMLGEHMITSQQATHANATTIKSLLHPTIAPNGCAPSWAPFFCDYVITTFLDNPAFGATLAARKKLLYTGGVTIRTTLRPKAQRAAQNSVDSHVPQSSDDGKVAAITMVQPGTGNIVAMAQNRKYGNGPGHTFINYNVNADDHGSQEGAAAGSTFKAFTLAAAIEKGLPLSTTLYAPQSTVYPPGSFTDCAGKPILVSWPVSNSTTTHGGTYNMYSGAALSVNTYFSGLEQKIGVCSAATMAKRLGVVQTNGSPVGINPSFTLGTDAVSPLSMANAYATFAARGEYCAPRTVITVVDRTGKKVDATQPQCHRALAPDVADAVNSVLAGVIDGPNPYRTGANMSLGRPAAGKTGTIDNNAAVWFVGYTPQLAAAATLFDPRGPYQYPLQNVTIDGVFYPVVYGMSIPGPIWKSAMLGALAGTAPQSFVPVNNAAILGRQIPVPFLAGLTPDAARTVLQKAGLLTTIAANPVQSTQPKGTVAYSSPAAATPTIAGTSVTLYLSNGVAPSASPSPTNSHSGSPSPNPSNSGNGHGNGNGNGH